MFPNGLETCSSVNWVGSELHQSKGGKGLSIGEAFGEMGIIKMQSLECKRDGILSNSQLVFQWSPPYDDNNIFPVGGLFASIGQMGNMGFGVSPNSPNSRGEKDGFKLPYTDLYVKYFPLPEGFKIFEEEGGGVKMKKRGGLKFKVKVANPSLRRLISGAIAGAVSRTAVAPLETIRTHLMVGSSGHSVTEVFNNIMEHDGWQGLFRGNLVNVIRVAPSKAIEVDNSNND